MARLCTVGFELNTTTTGVEDTSGSGSGAIIQSSIVYDGSYAYNVNVVAGSNSFSYQLLPTDTNNIGYASIRVYFAAWPSVSINPLIYRSAAAANIARLTVNSTGLVK